MESSFDGKEVIFSVSGDWLSVCTIRRVASVFRGVEPRAALLSPSPCVLCLSEVLLSKGLPQEKYSRSLRELTLYGNKGMLQHSLRCWTLSGLSLKANHEK